MLLQAVKDVIQSWRLLDGSVAMLTDSLAGHPRAAAYDSPTGSTPLHCVVHEQDRRACEAEGLLCDGIPTEGTDPVGEAAVHVDKAAETLKAIDGAVTALAAAAETLVVLLTRWAPTSSEMQRPDPRAADPPEGACSSCWRHRRTETWIQPRPGGEAPRYSKFCDWCGGFLAAHGYLPPVAVLKIRHDGHRSVTQNDITRHRPKSAST